MARYYDVIVLGAGNAGLAAARVTREAGKSVAVVESRAVGGTCPLRGCVPKKVLVAAAETADTVAGAGVHHITTSKPTIDWPRLIAREQSFTEGVPEAFTESLSKRGIEVMRGHSRFVGSHRVEIDGEVLEAGKIVIATGSKPRPLPIAGAERLITSDDLLGLKQHPKSITFIGGGVIALEFAHVFARTGAQITVLEMAPRLLPGWDADAVAKLHEATARAGIEVLTEAHVEQISVKDDRLEVHYRRNDEPAVVTAERVVNSTGRIPDVENLDLDAAGISHEGPYIAHADDLRTTSNPDVYVAGDAVSDSAQLSPLATYEGQLVGENIVHGTSRAPDYLPVPAVAFTVPALASVGYTQARAEAEGLRFEIRTSDMQPWLSARLYGSTVAYAKVLVEKDSGRVLGAHLVGKRAEELIHLFAFAMRFAVSADELRSFVYVFPTFSSEVASMV